MTISFFSSFLLKVPNPPKKIYLLAVNGRTVLFLGLVLNLMVGSSIDGKNLGFEFDFKVKVSLIG